jgi:hypothetical protein
MDVLVDIEKKKKKRKKEMKEKAPDRGNLQLKRATTNPSALPAVSSLGMLSI